MPNTKSAQKRLKQSVARKARNRAVKSALRSQIKKVRAAAEEGNLELAATEFRLAAKKLDQAAAKRKIHPNAAARVKSRLSSMLKKTKDDATAK